MSFVSPSLSARCPDPLARAPRASGASGASGTQPHARLYLAPPALQGALVAVICRDTRGVPLDSAQLLTHFPASPLVCLSWFRGHDVGRVERGPDGSVWRPFGTSVTVSGSQFRPTVSWAPATGHGGMACFTADIARALFDLDLADIHDRFVAADEVLGDAWRPLIDAPDDAATLAALELHVGARWHALQRGGSALASLSRIGRHWVERLAWQAHEWRRTHSPRQVERRIKAYSGRSLRDWQALVKGEGAFYAARARFDAGESFDWAALAQDEGFADQAHFSRMAKRITGFSPSEFAQRFVEDESFWLYRLWV